MNDDGDYGDMDEFIYWVPSPPCAKHWHIQIRSR